MEKEAGGDGDASEREWRGWFAFEVGEFEGRGRRIGTFDWMARKG